MELVILPNNQAIILPYSIPILFLTIVLEKCVSSHVIEPFISALTDIWGFAIPFKYQHLGKKITSKQHTCTQSSPSILLKKKSL